MNRAPWPRPTVAHLLGWACCSVRPIPPHVFWSRGCRRALGWGGFFLSFFLFALFPTPRGDLDQPPSLSKGVNLDGSEGAEEGKKEDPWFPSKLSACALYPAVLGCLPPGSGEMQLEKAQLLETLGALVDDEMPMVRAQAAASLGSVSAHVDAAAFKTYLGPALNAVLEDR